MVMLALVGTGTAIMARRLAIEREEALAARMETRKLEEFDRLRGDFISNITHDLRTPFTAVRAGLGMMEMSVADRLRPEELQLLANVRRNGDRLGILINDLLTFNQFESHALHIDMRPLDLAYVVTGAAAGLETLISEKNQTLHLDLAEQLPHNGDARRLEQVIVNLLDNAHRHTPPGTNITVTGRATPGEVLVVIRDDGPGIPPEECEAIFKRFHRVDLSEGGWGLGLTIAQAIVERHGGRIWVDSKLGQGAAFHIALPRTEDGHQEKI
jgi:signal transduction histidine kinase